MEDKSVQRRNILFHILDGIFFMGAMVFLDQFTIMTAFIRQISKNPLIISLIPAAVAIGFNGTGLLSANLIRKIYRKHLFVVIIGFFQRLMIMGLAIFTFALSGLSETMAGSVSALFYFMFTGLGGFGGPAWVDLLARTVPAERRGRVVAIRNSFGAGAGIIFPFLIAYLLNRDPFPANYRSIFYIAYGFLVLSLLSFVMIKDTATKDEKKAASRVRFGVFMKGLRRRDPNFILFTLFRFVYSFSVIPMTFFTVYFLKMNPGMDDAVVARFSFVLNVSKVLLGLILGFLGDKKGNLLVFKIGMAFVVLGNVSAYFTSSLPWFYIVYVAMGAVVSADMNTYQAMATEFGKPEERIYYATIGNSVAGLSAGFLPIVTGGLLSAGLVSYRPLFIICSLAAVIAFSLVQLKIKDPRHVSSAEITASK